MTIRNAMPACPDSDPDCLAQGCPEHPACDQGGHTYEQHHAPGQHVNSEGQPAPGECHCDVYLA